MRKAHRILCFWCGILLLAGVCPGCSSEPEKDKSGPAEQLTDKIAHKAEQKIRQPLERAQQALNIENAHIKAVDEAIEQSSQ